ncbi:MAG: xylulokinase [Acidimicrobiaceae bacterium]|nr:xylulokinase [Acidimicrobiaceae bacterium]
MPRTSRALVAGVDSSTQSTKVELRDIDSGVLVARATASHPPTSPPVSEQHPESWWVALVECFAQLSSSSRDVVAISVAGQQHGLVLLDDSGMPLRPAKLWNDTTSASQAERLVSEYGAESWAQACGSVPVPSFTVTKLAWVVEHEPELADRIAQIMLPHDYLTWRLTGRHVTDRGDASGTGWFDPRANVYREDMLERAGIADGAAAQSWLPEVLAADAAAGEVSDEAASLLGLGSGVIVGPGSGDNMGAALGLALSPGDAVISLGTSGTVYSVSLTATTDESGAVAGFADASGNFLPLVCTLNATKVTDTVARWLGVDAAGLSALALAAPPTAVPPVLIPYFDGERTPNLPAASGLFAGLRNDTSPEDLALAAHDGVLCGLLSGFDALTTAGVDTSGRLLLIGGGSRSAAYRQRAADLRNAPVTVPDDDETVAVGAAVQAAAISTASPLGVVAQAWNLGAGLSVDPATDATNVRDRYGVTASLAGQIQ